MEAKYLIVVTLVIGLLVGAGIGYVIKPTPPEIAELQAKVSELEGTVSDQESTISELESRFAKTQIGEGYYIVLVTGDETDAFTTTIVKGANDAAEQFGNTLDVLYSDGWKSEEFLTNLRTAIAMKPDGIIFHPFGDPDVLNEEIAKAYAQGTIVTLVNLDVPEIREKYVECGAIAQDLHAIGYALGKHAVEEFGLGPGDRCAVMCGFWTEPIFSKRTYGIVEALEEAGCIVDRIEHPPEIFADPEMGLEYISGYVAAHPDVKFIGFGGAGTTAVVDYYMKSMGKDPGEIKTGGFDLTPGAIRCIEDGYLSFTMDQQPYTYGYLSTLNLILTMKYGFMGFRIDTAGGWVDSTNVAFVKDLSEQFIR